MSKYICYDNDSQYEVQAANHIDVVKQIIGNDYSITEVDTIVFVDEDSMDMTT